MRTKSQSTYINNDHANVIKYMNTEYWNTEILNKVNTEFETHRQNTRRQKPVF